MRIKEALKHLYNLSKEYSIDTPYVVGGVPRDVFFGRGIQSEDVDITTNTADVLMLAVLFADRFNLSLKILDEGHALVFSDGVKFDFSTHKIYPEVVELLEKNESLDKKLHEVYSRDFTINTLHMHPLSQEIIDPTGMGKEDCKNRFIRTAAPPELTIAADPRRAFRAIKLAVQYDLTIDLEIISFCKANPDLFRNSDIHSSALDSIDFAMNISEDKTFSLLKQMGLVDAVPLSGKLKDFLLKNKSVLIYFQEKEKAERIMKKAEFVAKTWEEYSGQSGKHKELADYWKQNWTKIPGVFDDTYQSWKAWYKKFFKQEWGKHHKNPDEVLNIIKDYIQKPFSYDMSRGVSATPSFEIDLKEPPQKDRKLFDFLNRSKEGLSIGGLPLFSKKSQDIELSPASFVFLNRLSEKINFPVTITSGTRSLKEQAAAMWKNLRKKGFENLVSIYPDALVKDMQFAKGPEDIENILLQKQKEGFSISAHLSGYALDFSIRNLSGEERKELYAASKSIGAKVIDEGDHIHVQFGQFA